MGRNIMQDIDIKEFKEISAVVSLAKQVEDRIRTAITSGKMKPGVLYTEPVLAKQMGVSRTPVREAVLELASRGLVTILPRRGFQARHITENCIREVYGLRTALELYAVEMLARAPDKYDFKPMLATLAQQEKGAAQSELENTALYGLDFHLELLKLTGNSMSVKVYDDIQGILKITCSQAFARIISASSVVEDHKKLVEMIRCGKVANAREFLKKHLQRSEQAVLSAQTKIREQVSPLAK